ncbi:MAG: protein kinase [Acidobacteriota bacterium]|nr:protein kinase [Acidobacteriota bacterium]
MEAPRPSFGHYEVLGPIGSGGMGEVYVARDPKLGRKVAIKVLPLRLTAERDTLSRFTQEARSASALNHPNIVTIHEVGSSEGCPYIVMEYIEGHDLRTLVGGGALPVRKALDVACQIADGLAAAHERGIVHRDLKPENIMITRDGFVKILDFGLAKVISPAPEKGEDTLQLEMPGTNPGTILGTVGYMSPEQATGRRLDFRSDQFAFGAILYELVTGRPAFDGETAIDTLSAILHHNPPPITKTTTRAPVQLADIIGRLLAKSADDRYSSTRDLAREIRLLRDRIAAEESGFHQRVEPKRKPLVAIIAAVALTTFIAGVIFIARDRAPRDPAAAASAAEKKYLAVLGFTANDNAGQLVAEGFTETLTARLARYPTVQVMRPAATEPAPKDMREAARNLGANLVLSGVMQRDADRIRVTYTVVDPSTGRRWNDLIDGTVSDLFAVQDEVADSVARNLALGRTNVHVALDPAVSQRQYLEAIGYLHRYDDAKSVDNALRILKTLGPSATVQAALARAYLYKFLDTKQPAFAATASDAAAAALRADPQNIDVNVTLGELQRETGHYAESVAAFMRVLSTQPNHADAVLGLAATYQVSGDLKNAEIWFKRAIELQPNAWAGYNRLGAYYFHLGRYTDALAQFQKVIELVPDSAWGYSNAGGTLQRMGRYDEAAGMFAVSVKTTPTGQGYSNLGTTFYFLGKYADAARALEKATELAPQTCLYWRNLGDAYRWMPGREADARRAYERAIKFCDNATQVNAADAAAYTSRASALAKLNRVREARASMMRALELEPRDASTIYEAAVVANIAGDDDEALARIEQAIRFGANPSDFDHDPEFANLRKDGRLAAVVHSPRASDKSN